MNHEGPLVSIVLPTHNGSKYIRDSIQSCIDQSYPHWELLVVDDKSTDSTPSIVETFTQRDSRIKLIRHQQNKKLPGALNTGFKEARGEYLSWTSDDNMYEPEAIKLMLDYLQSHPSTDMVYCGMKVIDEEGKYVRPGFAQPPEQLDSGCCIGACFLYRRSVYEKVGEYALDMFLCEDYEYWLRVRKQCSMHYLEGPRPYLYRIHNESLTTKRVVDVVIQTARAQCRHITPEGEVSKRLDHAYLDALYTARRHGDASLAWQYAKLYLRNQPLNPKRWKSTLTTAIYFLLKKSGLMPRQQGRLSITESNNKEIQKTVANPEGVAGDTRPTASKPDLY